VWSRTFYHGYALIVPAETYAQSRVNVFGSIIKAFNNVDADSSVRREYANLKTMWEIRLCLYQENGRVYVYFEIALLPQFPLTITNMYCSEDICSDYMLRCNAHRQQNAQQVAYLRDFTWGTSARVFTNLLEEFIQYENLAVQRVCTDCVDLECSPFVEDQCLAKESTISDVLEYMKRVLYVDVSWPRLYFDYVWNERTKHYHLWYGKSQKRCAFLFHACRRQGF